MTALNEKTSSPPNRRAREWTRVEITSKFNKEQFLRKIEKILSPSVIAKRWGENIFSITVHGLLVLILKNSVSDDFEVFVIDKNKKVNLSAVFARGVFYSRVSSIVDWIKTRAVFVCVEEIIDDIKVAVGDS